MGLFDTVNQILTDPLGTKALQAEIQSLKSQLQIKDEALATLNLTIQGQTKYRQDLEAEIRRLQDLSLADHEQIATFKAREEPVKVFALKLCEAVSLIGEAVDGLPDELKVPVSEPKEVDECLDDDGGDTEDDGRGDLE